LGVCLNDASTRKPDAVVVKAEPKHTRALMDQGANLLFEMYLLRGDCCQAAQTLTRNSPLDHRALEDCARLDDSLAQTFRILQATTLSRMQRAKANSLP
jgi:hypothetical protein